MKLGICLLSFSLIGTAVQAQQIPASSVSGTYRAVAGIVVPSIPSNICTVDNNNCVTAATLPSYVAPLIPTQVAQPSPVPWTGYFIGQQKCMPHSWGMGGTANTCFTISSSGTIGVDTAGSNQGSTPLPSFNSDLSAIAVTDYCVGGGVYTQYVIRPTGLTLTNIVPSGWSVLTAGSYGTCDFGGGGGAPGGN